MGFGNQRIAIVGGGLGGMSFANAALHVGLTNVQLYERAPEFTEVGAGVNITRNANRVLDAYGLKDAMLKYSSHDPPSYMDYYNYKTGDFLGRIEEFGEPRSRQIHRAHLLEVLKERIPASVLNTGKQLESLKHDGKEYILSFKDGTQATADIVVGCDGIKSVVRRHLGIIDHPTYSGQMVYRGYVSYDDLTPESVALFKKTIIFRGRQKHVLTLPIGNEENKNARVGVIVFVTEPLESWNSESWLGKTTIDSLHEHIKDWASPCQELVEGLRKSSPDGLMLKQTLYVREPIDKWFEVETSRPDQGIVLVGDSVHSTLPHQGQGTCMAIESGFALATILRNWKNDDLSSAFQFYQQLRKPRTDKNTKTSYEAGKLASADVPDENVTANFNPDALRERMKWLMEGDILKDVYEKGAPYFESSSAVVNGY